MRRASFATSAFVPPRGLDSRCVLDTLLTSMPVHSLDSRTCCPCPLMQCPLHYFLSPSFHCPLRCPLHYPLPMFPVLTPQPPYTAPCAAPCAAATGRWTLCVAYWRWPPWAVQQWSTSFAPCTTLCTASCTTPCVQPLKRPLQYPLHCLLHYSLRSALETPPALPSALPPARAVPDPFCNAPSTTFFHHPLRPPPYNVVTGSLTPSAA